MYVHVYIHTYMFAYMHTYMTLHRQTYKHIIYKYFLSTSLKCSKPPRGLKVGAPLSIFICIHDMYVYLYMFVCIYICTHKYIHIYT